MMTMKPVFIKEMHGKCLTKPYPNGASILRKINGKHVTQPYLNDSNIHDEKKW